MNFSRSTLGLVICCLVLQCCAGKFDVNQPVEIEEGFYFGHKYRQGDSPVNPNDIADTLKARPNYEDTMSGYDALFWSGTILSSAGAALVGYSVGLALGSRSDWNYALVGAPIFIGGAILGRLADGKLEDAVRMHNGSVSQSSSRWNLVPFLTARTVGSPDGFRRVFVAGIAGTF